MDTITGSRSTTVLCGMLTPTHNGMKNSVQDRQAIPAATLLNHHRFVQPLRKRSVQRIEFAPIPASQLGQGEQVDWFDHNGKRQSKCAKTTDKAAAERLAAKYEADAALRREGVIDATLDGIGKESRRSIESHLADYENKLRAANRTGKHIASTLKFIRKVCTFSNFHAAVDLNADRVLAYVAKLQDDGRSARTQQSHLHAIKAFTKWLTAGHKLPRDPLANIKLPDPESDRRRERRMLLPDEFKRLLAATKTGPERYGMVPDERILLYRTAIQTGLRSNELRSLTRGRLFLDADKPFVTCRAGSTKNRKDARQYIQRNLAEDLRKHIRRKASKAAVFGLPHESNLAWMLRDDLAEARTTWISEAMNDRDEYARREEDDFLAGTNHDGEITDFHSLRHSCGAWLSMAGVHPKTVQTVMRHSTITLTMDTYGHLFPGQESDAINRMGDLLADPSRDPRGHRDRRHLLPQSAQQLAQQTGRESVRTDANWDERRNGTVGETETAQAF